MTVLLWADIWLINFEDWLAGGRQERLCLLGQIAAAMAKRVADRLAENEAATKTSK